ncbi:hypothetical protein BpHYR1_052940 [Brachionus plicatilis]|uniref:Uncharacterized protein n=1 Tax=Brachionus plicatilis TaxID=10195 RepID=A0A3M7RSF0_BRAPC|nr:hypothetical protein BpHYR1_052940 [Brachionus plicatilis]
MIYVLNQLILVISFDEKFIIYEEAVMKKDNRMDFLRKQVDETVYLSNKNVLDLIIMFDIFKLNFILDLKNLFDDTIRNNLDSFEFLLERGEIELFDAFIIKSESYIHNQYLEDSKEDEVNETRNFIFRELKSNEFFIEKEWFDLIFYLLKDEFLQLFIFYEPKKSSMFNEVIASANL